MYFLVMKMVHVLNRYEATPALPEILLPSL
jgi:hypothetical protein